MAFETGFCTVGRLGLTDGVARLTGSILGDHPIQPLVLRDIREVGLVLKDIGRPFHVPVASRARGGAVARHGEVVAREPQQDHSSTIDVLV